LRPHRVFYKGFGIVLEHRQLGPWRSKDDAVYAVGVHKEELPLLNINRQPLQRDFVNHAVLSFDVSPCCARMLADIKDVIAEGHEELSPIHSS
jgi:hypothetical protein